MLSTSLPWLKDDCPIPAQNRCCAYPIAPAETMTQTIPPKQPPRGHTDLLVAYQQTIPRTHRRRELSSTTSEASPQAAGRTRPTRRRSDRLPPPGTSTVAARNVDRGCPERRPPRSELDARTGAMTAAIRPAVDQPQISRRSAADQLSRRSQELHSLGQRQLTGVVDRVRRLTHVRLPRIRTGLTSAAGLLRATERAADLSTRGADVDVGDAGV